MASAPVDHNDDPIAPESPGLGMYLLKGSIIGALISFLVIGAGILALDVEWGSAVGIGLFIAWWGGIGFGVMLAGVVWLSFYADTGH